MLLGLDEAGIAFLNAENKKSPLKLRAVNSMFPWQFRLLDPGDSKEAIEAHYTRLFAVMERFGICYAVFGSGAARNIPNGMSREEGMRRMDEFLGVMAEKAESYGVTVVIEPLRRAETNVLIDIAESGETAERVNQSGLKLLCDAFHMAEEKTDIDVMDAYAHIILHCHMAESPNRSYPGKSDSADLSYNRRFAEKLISLGYTGGVSAECGFSDFRKEIVQTYAYMKEIFKR